jgi:hypothetical protein
MQLGLGPARAVKASLTKHCMKRVGEKVIISPPPPYIIEVRSYWTSSFVKMFMICTHSITRKGPCYYHHTLSRDK